jgi:hypothetical protein
VASPPLDIVAVPTRWRLMTVAPPAFDAPPLGAASLVAVDSATGTAASTITAATETAILFAMLRPSTRL